MNVLIQIWIAHKSTVVGASPNSRIDGAHFGVTGGLNVQSIHHVMPVVNSCHYAKLYPEFYALCEKYDCAPATEPNILTAGYRHLKHVYDLGELYRGPDYAD